MQCGNTLSGAFSDSVISHYSISVQKCRVILHQTFFLLLLIESFPALSQKLSVWFVRGCCNITFAVFKNNKHIAFKTGFVGHAYELHWLLWIQCNRPKMLKLFLIYFSTSCMKHELTGLHSIQCLFFNRVHSVVISLASYTHECQPMYGKSCTGHNSTNGTCTDTVPLSQH